MVATHATTVMIRVDGRERRYDSLTAAAAPVRDLCAKILEAERRLDGELQEDRIELGRRLIDLRAAFVRERGSEHGWRGFLSGVLPTLHHKKAQRCMSLAGWDSGRAPHSTIVHPATPRTASEKSGTACPTLEDRNASGASGEGWNASGADGEDDDDDLPPEADERFTVEGDGEGGGPEPVGGVRNLTAPTHSGEVAGSMPLTSPVGGPAPMTQGTESETPRRDGGFPDATPARRVSQAGASASREGSPSSRTPGDQRPIGSPGAERFVGGAAPGSRSAVQLTLEGEYREAAMRGREVVGLIERGELSPDQVRRFDAFARGLLAEGRAA